MTAGLKHVVWAPRAKRDLADVWDYYARVASVEVADNLLREINEAAARLSRNALRWRARNELMPRLRSTLVHPYVIFYRVGDETVQIVRVLHGRRNFPAILSKTER
jgi:toxin ParE1/3/4